MCKLNDERTLDELLARPMDLLVLVGRDEDDADNDDADADEDGDDSADEDDDDTSDEDGDDEDDADVSVDSLKKDVADRDEKIGRLTKKAKRQEERIATLIGERDDARSKAGKGEPDETTKQENQQLADANSKLSARVKELSLTTAFLQSNSHDWQNPATALKLADLSDVEVDEETGEVDKMDLKRALDKLAKDQPYLVKTAGKRTPPPKSGDKPGSQRRQQQSKNKKDQKKLLADYPALRNR